MDFVFIDNDFYKITLEFTRDFIDRNYIEWIENNNKEEIKISRWEMMIYFKKLNDVSQDTVDYFLIDAESKILKKTDGRIEYNSVRLKRMIIDYFLSNTESKLIVNYNGELVNNNNSGTKQIIEKCKNPVFIKIIMLHKDDKIIYNNIHGLNLVLHDIFNSIYHSEYTKYYDKKQEIYSILDTSFRLYCNMCGRKGIFIKEPTFIDKVITVDSCEVECVIVQMVKKHYREIIDDIEGYIIYCKTEKLKVDFNKIGRFINFIKEYVKSTYGIDLI